MRSAALALLCACANAGSAIYVDVASGSDDNPGTADAPKQTIGAALTAAVDLHRDLNVGKGTYPEAITLVDGISIYGGGGVNGPNAGVAGNAGGMAPGGALAAPGGVGGASGSCSLTSSSDGGTAPATVGGSSGMAGAVGTAGPALGHFDLSGAFQPAAGGDGHPGTAGGGGGGGGSGGGSADGPDGICSAC